MLVLFRYAVIVTLIAFFSVVVEAQNVANEKQAYEYVYQAKKAYEEGAANKALKWYKKAHKEAPMDANLNYIMSSYFARKGKEKKAFFYLNNYVDLAKYDVVDFSFEPQFFNLSFKYYEEWEELVLKAFNKRQNLTKLYNSDYKRFFSDEEAKEDFKILKDVLEYSHPGYNWYSTKEYKDSIFNSITTFSDSISFSEMMKKSVVFVEEVHCGHTAVQFSSSQIREFYSNELFFPYPFKVYGDQMYMLNTDIDSVYEVISLNSKSVKELIQEVHFDVYGDGYSKSLGKYDLEEYIDIYLELYLVENDTFKLKMREVNADDVFTETISGVDGDVVQENYQVIHSSFYKSIDYSIGDNHAYLQINSFTEHDYQFFEEDFETTLDHFFTMVKDSNKNNLIIDLRENPGGQFDNVRKLLSYFVSPENSMYKQINITDIDQIPHVEHTNIHSDFIDFSFKSHFTSNQEGYIFRDEFIANYPLKYNNYSGKVYILTSGISFSGSSIFTQMLKNYYSDVKVVGQETGGGRNGTTAYYSFDLTLPNSGLEVSIPIVQFVFDNEQKSDSGGIIPDIPYELSIDDYLSEEDRELQFTINLIDKNERDK